MFSKFLIVFLWACLISYAYAAKYHGRFTLGSFMSKETFKEESAETSNNNFNILSSRLYLDVSEMGDGNYSFITDLRDKHDFFNKLDKERLELAGKNDFQVRQLYLKYPNPSESLYYNLGRFSPIEAGSIYLDGLQVGFRLWDNFSLSALAGNNPKKETESYLEADEKAVNKGITSLFFKKARKHGAYYYLANSYVIQTYDNVEDRKFWFHNSIIQFDPTHRLTTLFYLDFVPTEKFQNIWVNYWFKERRIYSVSLSGSRVDVIEYSRKQDIRETLESSIYDQYNLSVRGKFSSKLTMEFKYLNGKRQKDELLKQEGQLGFIYHRFFSKNKNLHLFYGNRDNFVTDDTFIRIGIDHFSDNWEFSLEQMAMLEEDAQGELDTVSITELSASHLYSRRLFTTISLQSANDKKVNILSVFFKLTYRFGNREVAPIRDGATPQGKL